MSNSLIAEIIDEWVQGDKNRKIMKDRHINLLCYEKLAERHALSVSTIQRIINKYDAIFFRELDKALENKPKSYFFNAELIGI